jgi:hypothetical protein
MMTAATAAQQEQDTNGGFQETMHYRRAAVMTQTNTISWQTLVRKTFAATV